VQTSTSARQCLECVLTAGVVTLSAVSAATVNPATATTTNEWSAKVPHHLSVPLL